MRTPNGQTSYPFLSAGAFTAALAVRETGPAGAPKPRLLDRVREAIAARHYTHRTEKAYIHWIKRYTFFHGKRHPNEMGAAEVTAFLTSLAVHDNVAASTQNQALSALLFLYREVLGVELPWLDDVIRATRPQHLPVAASSRLMWAHATRCTPHCGTVAQRRQGLTSQWSRRPIASAPSSLQLLGAAHRGRWADKNRAP